MKNRIPYGRQHIADEDVQAVVDTLRSDYLTQGPRIAKFEKAFADYVGCKYAVGVSNGTAALHLCNLALGVRPGHKVITTPITFSATANSVRYCGGEVVFADIDPETCLLDVQSVRDLLEASPKGTYQGIIPVDFTGRAVNLEEFRNLADQYGLWIVEDACHAPGGYFIDSEGREQYCGNGEFADLAIFSFHPVKHIATGEGGMITTNNPELYQSLLRLRSHGITSNSEEFINSSALASAVELEEGHEYPAWYMELQRLGFNYRITDIQSALGTSQLTRAKQGLIRRKQIVKKYEKVFKDCSFIKGTSGYVEGHAYHLYVIQVSDRLGLFNHLRSCEIGVQIHYIPLHLMPYYQQFGWKKGDFKHAEEYYAHCISLPVFPTLTDEQQDFVIERIMEFYGE